MPSTGKKLAYHCTKLTYWPVKVLWPLSIDTKPLGLLIALSLFSVKQNISEITDQSIKKSTSP